MKICSLLFTNLVPSEAVVKLDPSARDNPLAEEFARYFHPYP